MRYFGKKWAAQTVYWMPWLSWIRCRYNLVTLQMFSIAERNKLLDCSEVPQLNDPTDADSLVDAVQTLYA